jgi:signal transduction histidine kinase
MDKNSNEINNDLEKIMNVIHHDLKLPLTSLSFNVQAIKRMLTADSEEEIIRRIECIENKVQQMCAVVEHITDLTRAESKELPLKKNLTHTHDLVADTVHYTREKIGDQIVELENHSLNQYCTVACDKDRLVQVFSNVIHSLAELNPAKSVIKLSTKIKGEVAQFFFKNESYTMEESLINSIFDKFCVLSAKRTTLGLALSKWIIEAHKGSICIESKENLGTIFTIELPVMELEKLKASLA